MNYDVQFVPIDQIHPSPENDQVYGEIVRDEQMDALIDSIRTRGLEEPLIATADNFILSGHRRLYACRHLKWKEVPVRVKEKIRRGKTGNKTYHKLLTEYNPQRIKTAGALLKEALLRLSDEDPTIFLRDHQQASIEVDADFIDVSGFKDIREISEKKQEFLEAVVDVASNLKSFWPLSVRQIHYQLLNDPPLISVPRRSKFGEDHYRYRNDKTSYDALVEILKQARYLGHVDMSSIDDPTRPMYAHDGYCNVSQFIRREIKGFLCGYHRDRQIDQPRHLEVLGEKNTLMQILKPICREYYVPLTLARGYASVPVWRDMTARFKKSGKDVMTLIVASDYDPEGFDLADDAIRSLRDLWGVSVDYHRIAVNEEQIEEQGLHTDFNPAKQTSTRLKAFIDRTGADKTWELEALLPVYLQNQIRAAIEANMDMEIYAQTVDQEKRDAEEIADFRHQLVNDFNF